MFAMLLTGMVILIGVRLPSFLNNPSFTKKDKVVVVIVIVGLLVFAVVASGFLDTIIHFFTS